MHQPLYRPRTGFVATVASLTLLTGCGMEAVGTAATSAAIKKQEVEQAQANKQAVQQRLEQAMQQGQQRQQALDEVTKQ